MAPKIKNMSRRGKHQPSGGSWIRPEKRLAINLRDNMTCVYCLKNLHGTDPRDITLDHLVCKADNGSNCETNLITACRSCNSSRQDKPLNRFATKEQIAHIRRNTRRNLAPYLKLAKAYIAGTVGNSIPGKDS